MKLRVMMVCMFSDRELFDFSGYDKKSVYYDCAGKKVIGRTMVLIVWRMGMQGLMLCEVIICV